MTNYEKHKDEIIKYSFINNLCKLKQELIGTDCSKVKRCSECKKLAKEWLEAEYVEPEIDWSKVEQGTRVYCKGDGFRDDRRFVSTYMQCGVMLVVVINVNSGLDTQCVEAHLAKNCRLEK